MTIQIEEGKFYKRADGTIHGPAVEDRISESDPYPWLIQPHGRTDLVQVAYTDAGQYYSDQSSATLDLVAEVPMLDEAKGALNYLGVEAPNPAIEDEGFITRDTPDWAKQVEAEAAEEKLALPILPGKMYRRRDGRVVGPTALYRDGEELSYGPIMNVHDSSPVWANTGRVNGIDPNSENAADLVAEVMPPIEVPPFLKAEPLDIKVQIADEAKNIVSGARRSAYGKPEANFERIARFWQAYFENTGRGTVNITAADVSPLMRLMKEARLAESPNHYDSFVDLIGYTLTGAEVNGISKPR